MVMDFRLVLGETGYRGNLRELLQGGETKRFLTLLDDALELSYDVMKLSLGRSQLLDSAFERATVYRNRLKRLIDTSIPGYSYWFESYGRHFLLAITPLSVADKFRELIKSHKSSWVFTSATLSVNEQMSYYTDRLGLENATTLILNSPFDYQHQTLLCVPRYLPPLNQPYTAKRLATMLTPVILKTKVAVFSLYFACHDAWTC